jgi:hypothetical protein
MPPLLPTAELPLFQPDHAAQRTLPPLHVVGVCAWVLAQYSITPWHVREALTDSSWPSTLFQFRSDL